MTDRVTPSRPILHVIDQASPQSDPVTLCYIGQLDEPVLLLGGTPLRRRAQAARLNPERCEFLSVPTGHAGWGVATLRRWFARQNQAAELHVWSLSVLSALRWLGHARGVTLHLHTMPAKAKLSRLRSWTAQGLKIQTLGEVLRERLISHGFAAEHLTAKPLWSVATASPYLTGQREELRAAWGIPEEARVVAFLGDPVKAADLGPIVTAIDLVGLATDQKLYVLTHPLQAGRARTQTVLDAYRQPDRMIQDARVATPWRVLAGCDAVILSDQNASASARFAVAAGLPIVAPDLPHHREALTGAERAHFARTAEPKRLADQLQHHALGIPTKRRPVSAVLV